MTVKSNVQKLNSMILKGQIIEAFDRFYGDDVVMQENNDKPRIGKKLNRDLEMQFMSNIKSFNGAEIKGISFNEKEGLAMIEWFMDITFKDGKRKKMAQVAVQRWKDNKIVHERFYHDPR